MTYSQVFARKTVAWVGFFILASIIWRGPALADRSKIAPELYPIIKNQAQNTLAAASAGGPVRVIVTTNGLPSRGVLNAVGIHGGRVQHQFSSMSSFAAEIPASQLVKFSDNQDVVHISLDHKVAACFDRSDETVGGDHDAVSPYGADGTGVTVAVIDSGLAPHADLPSSRIVAWKDFVNGRSFAYDDCGHGTHVAGIVGGSGKMSSGFGYTATFRGIAPKANLVIAKVLGADGSGYTSDVISAIDWAITNASTTKVRVINLSLGYAPTESYRDDPLCQAVERAVAANIVVVCSAGNMGPNYGTIKSPANDPAVITVGATRTNETPVRSDDEVFYFSSRGPTRIDNLAKPDIVAPGNDIVSLRARGSYLDSAYPGNRVAVSSYSLNLLQEPQYFKMSGTSAAAPMVSAAAALLIQKAPKLDANLVKAILMFSASQMNGIDPLTNEEKVYDPMTVGAGMLNVSGALAVCKNLDFGKASGQYWARGPMAGVNTIQGEAVSWNQFVLWGNTALTGDVLLYNDPIWGSAFWGGSVSWIGNAIYNADVVDAYRADWTSFWAPDPVENPDAQVYGDNAIWGGRGSFYGL